MLNNKLYRWYALIALLLLTGGLVSWTCFRLWQNNKPVNKLQSIVKENAVQQGIALNISTITPTFASTITPTITPPIVKPQHGAQANALYISSNVPTDTRTSARLIISSIGVNAAIETVGVAADGSLQTPAYVPWDDVGLYANGAQPGQAGSAVIDGHLDRPGGGPAVFWNLRYLQPGAIVTILQPDNSTLHFRVNRLETHAPSDSTAQIFGQSNGSFLNLITCAGSWIPALQQTTQRLVVFTSLVS